MVSTHGESSWFNSSLFKLKIKSLQILSPNISNLLNTYFLSVVANSCWNKHLTCIKGSAMQANNKKVTFWLPGQYLLSLKVYAHCPS